MDQDGNIDPSPAKYAFVILPPVWQRAWFITLMGALFSAIVFQTVRIIRRDRRLSEANAALSSANKKLIQANVDLQEKTDDLEMANRTIYDQNERKSRFLSAISHELRTPLAAIKGYANNLLDGIGGPISERQ